jgi:hypothetical protein
MTWLRLISAWFILYLSAVLTLCTTKLLTKKPFPILVLCALLLLFLYITLGYLNPNNFINWYNLEILN